MGKQLFITSDILLKVEYDLWEDGYDRFFFDYDTYEFKSKGEILDSSYSIPLIHVSQVSVMKAFINDLNDRKMSAAFKELSDKELWSRFWLFFDDDGIKSSRWHEYENRFCQNLITNWCKESEISYRIVL